MDPMVIIALIGVVEQLVPQIYKLIEASQASPDDKAAYIARIQAAIAAVPDPKVG
jgi:hypothetical protein